MVPITDCEQTELHAFTDVSGKAHSAVVYLRVQIDSSRKTSLVFAKSRLNPIKDMSLPRLELLGVLIEVRSLQFVLHKFQFISPQIFLWSNSKCSSE